MPLFGPSMGLKSRMDNINAGRTWPQLVCCALVTSGVLISGGENRGSLEKTGTTSQRSKFDCQTEGLQKYRIQLYIRSRKVGPNVPYSRKTI